MPLEISVNLYEALTIGPAYSFRDVLHDSLPIASIGVYTIWKGPEFLYVGIAGRNLDLTLEHKRSRGMRDRLDSHRSGRRSGDQFCVYVCDRLVLPTLTTGQIKDIATGTLSLDVLTRLYIHEHMTYRFAATDSYQTAFQVEVAFARGETPLGLPLLNPARTARTLR